MPAASRTVRRSLAAHPASVGEGRRFIREVLTGTGQVELQETAELLVSEVVTNALVHAGTEMQLAAQLTPSGLRVEVSDGSRHAPSARNYITLAATGRGLRLLEEMVDRWGVEPGRDGKTVWFELGTPGSRADDPGAAAPTAARPEQPAGVVVKLLNVPLLLHAAWQMQAESLLREYLLSRIGEDSGTDHIEEHAAASDAIALLQEQIPAPEFDDDPDAIMAAAVEPLVSAEHLQVTVPDGSVPHFDVLDVTLAAAIGLADAGELLTPPTQPEAQALRRWLCAQVREQVGGAVPVAWDGGTDCTPTGRPAVEWDAASVTGSATAAVAADDTNRIVAASPAAVALLGYDDPAELARLRLVDLIPVRYRQAHLAGFTLHLFAGRSPLLGTPVVVPALRRDGVEIVVEMTLEARRLPGGRRVFVAALADPGRPGRDGAAVRSS